MAFASVVDDTTLSSDVLFALCFLVPSRFGDTALAIALTEGVAICFIGATCEVSQRIYFSGHTIGCCAVLPALGGEALAM